MRVRSTFRLFAAILCLVEGLHLTEHSDHRQFSSAFHEFLQSSQLGQRGCGVYNADFRACDVKQKDPLSIATAHRSRRSGSARSKSSSSRSSREESIAEHHESRPDQHNSSSSTLSDPVIMNMIASVSSGGVM